MPAGHVAGVGSGLQQRQAAPLQLGIADRMPADQPGGIGAVLTDQRNPRPAVRLHDLAEPVAVSAMHDRHQRVVAVEQSSVGEQALAQGAVLGGHRQQLLAQKQLDHVGRVSACASSS